MSSSWIYFSLITCNRCLCVLLLLIYQLTEGRMKLNTSQKMRWTNVLLQMTITDIIFLGDHQIITMPIDCILYRSMILIFTEIGNVIYLSEFDRSVQPMVTAEVWDQPVSTWLAILLPLAGWVRSRQIAQWHKIVNMIQSRSRWVIWRIHSTSNPLLKVVFATWFTYSRTLLWN